MTLYVTDERDEAIDRLVRATAHTADPWTIEALRTHAGPDADLLFPGGLVELIEAWADLADRRMIDQADPSEPSLTARVRDVILRRLEDTEPNREQVRRALALLALPQNVPTSARMTARTVDAIWLAAGDDATGLAWYTKRAILAAVYGASLLYWVAAPRSRDEMEEFVRRRLEGAARLGRFRRRLSPGRA
jgi:ubiquinone biosynthesis protein COQ9